MTELEKKCFNIANECATKLNLKIVEVSYVKEFGEFILRVIADKDGGLDINDATVLNEAISNELDKYDLIKEEYLLEVSSPGIERELKNEEDYASSVGQYVCIYTKDLVEGKKELYGDLLEYSLGNFKLKINLKGRMKVVNINIDNIEKIRLAVKF